MAAYAIVGMTKDESACSRSLCQRAVIVVQNYAFHPVLIMVKMLKAERFQPPKV
jgi:hypothetical protein